MNKSPVGKTEPSVFGGVRYVWLESSRAIWRSLSKYTYLLGLCGLVLVAFAVRLFMARFELMVGTDDVTYLTLASNILSRGRLYIIRADGFHYYPVVLFSLLIATISPLAGNIELAGRFVSIVSGSLLTLPVYFLASKLYGKSVAWECGILVAFFPALVGQTPI